MKLLREQPIKTPLAGFGLKVAGYGQIYGRVSADQDMLLHVTSD